MHPAILPAALAFSAATAMAAYVAQRRDKTDLHWLLLGVLGALMIWTTGTLFRFSVTSQDGLIASLRLAFLGILLVPPFWLLLAAHYARVRGIPASRATWPRWMAPSLLAYVALLTNEGHHLFLRDATFETLMQGPRAWAGPAFWAAIAWSYVCVLGGAGLYLATARRMAANDERRRPLLLAVAAVIPVLVSAIYMFRLLPVPFDLTPAGIVVSLALISTATFRYQLLESVPLTRRDVLENLRDGVVIASASGAILDANPAAEGILGSGLRGRLLGEALAGLAGDAAPPDLRAALESLHRTREPVHLELHAPGDRTIALSAAAVVNPDGEVGGRFAVLRDRSEERRYELLVQQTQRLETVGTLAAGIAHEVNNPLAFIRANLSQIQRMGELVEECGEEGPDAKLAAELADLRQIADETLDGIGRIERIVSDMRRLSSARDDAVEPIDVNELVRDAIRLANLGRHEGVEMRLYLADGLPPVVGSPRRLVQALLNLVVNARQALADGGGGTIEVATVRVAPFVEIRVRDDGPGVPEEIRTRVFDPFFTTKDPDQGTGLGLSIAFDILREHGGALELAPVGSDRGATFTARIPIARA